MPRRGTYTGPVSEHANAAERAKYESEIQKTDPATIVSLNKPAKASSVYQTGNTRYEPSFANDGLIGGDTEKDPMFISDNGDVRPWWSVNLKDTEAGVDDFKIEKITIFNRTDGGGKLDDINLVILNKGREVYRHKVVGKPTLEKVHGQEAFNWPVPGYVVGDTVRIEKVGEGLSLPEVQVWGKEPEISGLCRHGDFKTKPKMYAIRLMANRNMCWKWSTDESKQIEVTDDCKDLDDPRSHFILDTQMRIHSGRTADDYMKCVELSDSAYKTGSIIKGGVCAEAPTQKLLANMNTFIKEFKGCPGGTIKPMKFYPTGYGRIHMLGALDKCIGIEGDVSEFEGTHNLAIDECTPDLKDQLWEMVPVPGELPTVLAKAKKDKEAKEAKEKEEEEERKNPGSRAKRLKEEEENRKKGEEEKKKAMEKNKQKMMDTHKLVVADHADDDNALAAYRADDDGGSGGGPHAAEDGGAAAEDGAAAAAGGEGDAAFGDEAAAAMYAFAPEEAHGLL